MPKQLEKFLLPLIVLVASALRLIWINSVPTAINHDQLYYLINSKSMFLTGKDVFQNVSLLDIFLFKYPPHALTQAELPFLLSYLSVGPFPFSLAMSALPNAVLSILTVIVIYGVANHFFKNKVALITAAVAALNPWFIFSGRTLYEAVPATFFFSLAFYILLITKGWKILLVLPILLLAFYSYIGTKIIFLPLVLIFVGYSYLFINNKKYLKYYISVVALSLVIVLFYAFQIFHTGDGSRLSEIVSPNNAKIIEQVNESRRLSLPSPLVSIFENKVTVFVAVIIKLLVESFSLNYLFLEGDFFFSLDNHGLFYIVDAVFLLIGAVALFKKKKSVFILFLSITLLSTVPQLIHDPTGKGGNFTPHISLIFPFFIMVIAYGIWDGITRLKGNYQKLFLVGVVAIYLISLGNFAVQYYYQLPYKNGIFKFTSRELAHYLYLAKSQSKVTVYAQQPDELMSHYIFYTNEYNENTAKSINEKLRTKDYKIGNISFISCNLFPKDYATKEVTVIEADCDKTVKTQSKSIDISYISDSGAVFRVFNDKLCNGITIRGWIEDLTIDKFSVEKLNKNDYCKTFMTYNS